MTGRAILVSLIVLLATVAITARADDRVPGRYVPEVEERTSTVTASSPSGDVRPHWTERYQALIAGILAVVAAGGGGLILWLTTNRRIDAEHALECERREREATAVAHALAGEFQACVRQCEVIPETLRTLVGSSDKQAEALAVAMQQPSATVFGGVAGQLGLLGPSLAEEVAVVHSGWDAISRFYLFKAAALAPCAPIAVADAEALEVDFKGLGLRAERLARALRAFPDDDLIAAILDEPYRLREADDDPG